MSRKINHLQLFGSIIIVVLFLVACNSTNNQQPDTNGNASQENQVLLPAVEVGSPVENAPPTEISEEPYPSLDEGSEANSLPAPEETVRVDSYPAPEPSSQDIAGEAYPEPEETALKPTPRSNSLVATDPGTVNLASGQLQLVEMFAFW